MNCVPFSVQALLECVQQMLVSWVPHICLVHIVSEVEGHPGADGVAHVLGKVEAFASRVTLVEFFVNKQRGLYDSTGAVEDSIVNEVVWPLQLLLTR